MGIARKFIHSYHGLSPEAWWLAAAAFVNKAGTMVLPFLSIYLTSSLGFSVAQVGWIFTAFGAGAILGSWIGGRLTDAIGHYRTMILSLSATSVLFVGLQYVTTYWLMVVSVFVILTVASVFTPALYVAVASYCREETKTRTITLIRTAVNLGYTGGPALAGLIIGSIGYGLLFWIDGVTCALAALVILIRLAPTQKAEESETTDEGDAPSSSASVSPYRDKIFMTFIVLLTLLFIALLQPFSSFPLYYRDVHFLSETQIGLVLGLNAVIIILLEMPLVHWLEGRSNSHLQLMATGTFFVCVSFLILNLAAHSSVVLISMAFFSLGEMFATPFAATFAIERGAGRQMGQYVALTGVSLAVAELVGTNLGLQSTQLLGYAVTWYLFAASLMLCVVLFLGLDRMIQREALRKLREENPSK